MSMPVNAAHWHLILNHMPIFFVAIGLGVLIAGIWRDSVGLKITSLVLFFLAGAVVVPVAWSGDEAEHLMDDYGGIDDQYMEQHEEAGHTTRNILIGLGLLSLGLGAWSYWQGSIPRLGLIIVGLVGLIALYYLLWTAYLGGKARHVELRASHVHPSLIHLAKTTPTHAETVKVNCEAPSNSQDARADCSSNRFAFQLPDRI